MWEYAVQGAELKRMVKLARKQPVSFAFSPGKTDPETLFGMHRRKPPALLGKSAKKEGSGVKVAFGTCEVTGKVMELTCERVIPAMAKRLKRYLKSQKVMLNVSIMDPEGVLLESDVEDLPDDPSLSDDEDTARAEHAESAPPLHAAALIARLNAIRPGIKAAPQAAAEKLAAAFKVAASQIKAGRLQDADAIISRIEAALARLGATTAGDKTGA